MTSVHASCVAFGPVGVLIRGPSGSGKSSLCLQLLDQCGYGIGASLLRARLVADDQVVLTPSAAQIVASAPPALFGKLEIRGLGIVTVDPCTSVVVRMIVELVIDGKIARLPSPEFLQGELCGLGLPRLELCAKAPDNAAKLRSALGHYGLIADLQNASI